MTFHKAQGLTCDRAFTLGSDRLYREQGYVAMSRGRLGNHLYVVGPRPLDVDNAAHAPTQDRKPDDLLAAGLATSKAQTLAVDHLAEPSLLTWTIGDLFAEQRRLRLILAEAPEDRTRDIDSLTRMRDALVQDLHALDCRRTDLTGMHRTWRDRRRGPDPELLLVEAKQSDATLRLAKVDGDLEAAHVSNLARGAFLADHEPVVRRLDQITDILNDRVDRAVCRAINEPPAYLTRVLAPATDRWRTSRRLDRRAPHSSRRTASNTASPTNAMPWAANHGTRPRGGPGGRQPGKWRRSWRRRR